MGDGDDLKKVNLEENLNNPHVLQLFHLKMPVSLLEKYIDLKQSLAMEGKKLHNKIDNFLDHECDRQKEI